MAVSPAVSPPTPDRPSAFEFSEMLLGLGFLNAALHRLHRLVVDRPDPLTEAWIAQYREAWAYFQQVQARYQEHAAALAAPRPRRARRPSA